MPYSPEVIDEMIRLRKKALNAAYRRQYRLENGEQLRQKSRQYRQENAGRMREYHRNRYQEKAEQMREYNRQRFQENPEHWREYYRNRYQENADKIREYKRQWRQENPDKIRATNASNYAKSVGLIPHVEHCQHCFEKAERLEMHHPNLDYPEADDLNVVHLCVSCHKLEHSRINDENRQTA